MRVLAPPGRGEETRAPPPRPSHPTPASAAAPSSLPPPPSRTTVKLLSSRLELRLEEAKAQLTDSPDFSVLGMLGPQGVGKSTLLSLLAGAAPTDLGVVNPPFAVQGAEAVLAGAHTTSGVDLSVTAERLLLLDTQPLLSPSVLLEMMRSQPPLPPEAQTYENLMELWSLRLSMLLLSVCHHVSYAPRSACLHAGSPLDEIPLSLNPSDR